MQKINNIEQYFSTVFDYMPLIVFLLDPERNVININQLAKDFVKYSNQKIVGKKIGSAIKCANLGEDSGECGKTVHCANCKILSAINQTFITGKAQKRIEAVIRQHSENENSIMHALISTVILDVQDSKTILVSIEDITDLKNSYNKLKYANEYTESIMESINDILIVTDKNNLITKVNKNTLELLEYSQNDLIGQPLAMILTQDNVDFPDIKIESLKASTNCDFELSITTKSDLVIPISCSRSSFNDPYGKLSGFVIIARDLRNIKALKTDLRELKETHRKLMHVERLSTAGILAAGISHTVGNVLANLKASLSGNIEEIVKLRYITELDQLFKSDSDVEERCKQYDVIFRQYSSRIRSKFLNQVQDFIHDTKPQKEYTKFRKKIVDTAYSRIYSYSDGLLEQVDFMDENIKGLLSLSKKDSSEKNMVNIRDVLNTARTMLNNYEKHGIYFVEEIHQSSPSLLMNFHRMLDCVLNIMLNGIESMQSGGRLTYGTYLENDKKTTIYIEDEGKGIPSEITDKISEPFFSTKNNGTGLGLSMTYNFIEEIGGNIKFESKKKGTRFTITLPC